MTFLFWGGLLGEMKVAVFDTFRTCLFWGAVVSEIKVAGIDGSRKFPVSEWASSWTKGHRLQHF